MSERDRHVLKTVFTKDVQIVGGSGCRFRNSEGNEYLDFFGQGNTMSVGYNNRAVLDTIQERLEGWVSVTTYMLNEDQTAAADLLAEILTGRLSYSAFYSSGSAAVETALKLAFRGTGRRKVGAGHAGPARGRAVEERYEPLQRTRGLGLQNTVETTKPDNPWKGDLDLAGTIAEKLYEKGIYVFGSKKDRKGGRSTKFNFVRDLAKVGFYPPRFVTQDEIDQAMDAFEDFVREALA